MSKKGSIEASFTVVFEEMDDINSFISQAEISLVLNYASGVYDDRVKESNDYHSTKGDQQ